jgi:hypothetical protein
MATCSASAIYAAPTMEQVSLSLKEADLAKATQYFTNEKDLAEFGAFITSLPVVADHENKEDDTSPKKYHILPYLQVAEGDFAGSQYIANSALSVMTNISNTMNLLGSNLEYMNLIQGKLSDVEGRIKGIDAKLEKNDGKVDVNFLKGLRAELAEEKARLEAKLESYLTNSTGTITSVNAGIYESAKNRLISLFGMVGITADAKEQGQLLSADRTQHALAFQSMSTRATNNGQFAVRNVLFESKFTERQKNFVEVFRKIKPEVSFSVLRPKKMRVQMTASTSSKFPDTLVEGTRLFLPANGGTDGFCGASDSCNVTIEATYHGATGLATSTFGKENLPVAFSAEVEYVKPSFQGRVWCDFTTGWKSTGRADVKSGAIIYDGDITNKIKFESIEEGDCKKEITSGSDSDANYHLLSTLLKDYLSLKSTRATMAKKTKDDYEADLNRKLEDASTQSQKKKSGSIFSSVSTWTSAFGSTWGTVASYVVHEADNFFWHTRINDTSSLDKVKFDVTISESGVRTTQTIGFDGKTTGCWFREGSNFYFARCKTFVPSRDADLASEKKDAICGSETDVTKCQEKVTNLPTDTSTGAVSDPTETGSNWEELFN